MTGRKIPFDILQEVLDSFVEMPPSGNIIIHLHENSRIENCRFISKNCEHKIDDSESQKAPSNSEGMSSVIGKSRSTKVKNCECSAFREKSGTPQSKESAVKAKEIFSAAEKGCSPTGAPLLKNVDVCNWRVNKNQECGAFRERSDDSESKAALYNSHGTFSETLQNCNECEYGRTCSFHVPNYSCQPNRLFAQKYPSENPDIFQSEEQNSTDKTRRIRNDKPITQAEDCMGYDSSQLIKKEVHEKINASEYPLDNGFSACGASDPNFCTYPNFQLPAHSTGQMRRNLELDAIARFETLRKNTGKQIPRNNFYENLLANLKDWKQPMNNTVPNLGTYGNYFPSPSVVKNDVQQSLPGIAFPYHSEVEQGLNSTRNMCDEIVNQHPLENLSTETTPDLYFPPFKKFRFETVRNSINATKLTETNSATKGSGKNGDMQAQEKNT